MYGDCYRFTTPILVIYTDAGQHKIPITLPQGTTVKVLEVDINESRLLDVAWEDKVVMMFSIDLRDRCKKQPRKG